MNDPRRAWMSLVTATLLLALPGLSPAAKDPPALRVMCVGDSITAGYTDNPHWRVPFQFGYRAGLYRRLSQAGYRVQFVGGSPEPWNGQFGKPHNTPALDLRTLDQDHHRGYGGWNTGQILANIEGWLAADRPDVILLMIGINDGGSPTARDNLGKIVDAVVARCPQADLIVAQITPMASFSQSIADYNTYIRDTLVPQHRARGHRVSTVDQYKNLLTRGKIDWRLFSNGLNHPNAAAYDRMAQTWFEGIRAVRPPAGAASRPATRAQVIAREWSGAHAARDSAGRLVIEDEKAWQAAWADMMGNVSPRPEAPKVDFAAHRVVAVFMGERNTGGYSIWITGVDVGEKVRVKVKESSPPPDAMVTQALTSPYHAMVIPRTDKPVEFVGE